MTDESVVPYIGLRPFGLDDSDRFFGRTAELREVAVSWQANRLTVLYGPSGVGKTSLVEAGVLPHLDRSRLDVRPVGRVSHGSAFPLAALPEHNPYTFALLTAWAPEASPTRLTGLTIRDFLARERRRVDRYGDPVPVMIAIDQAEELFSGSHRQQHRAAFIEGLADALERDPDLRLLLSIREDYLAALLEYEPRLGARSRARVALRAFQRDAALEAVRGPLDGTGRTFAPGASDRLVDELRTVRLSNAVGESTQVTVDTVEPVQLQVVCSGLWRSLPAAVRVITDEHVRQNVDVDRTLAAYCARVLEEVAAEHELTVAELTDWLGRSFITELGTRGTVYEGLTRTAGMPNPVVRALEDRRILRAENRSGIRWYELQHDRLIEPIGRAEDLVEDTGCGIVVSPVEYLRTAEEALAEGELDLAERYARSALQEGEGVDLHVQGDVHSFLGNVAHVRGDFEAAAGHYRSAAGLFTVLEDTPAVGRLLWATGRLLLDEGKGLAAVEELRGAVERLPNEAAVQTELARAFAQIGRWRAALGLLDEVIGADPDDPDALSVRGEIRAEFGDPGSALADLDRISVVRPAARAARALALARLARPDEAVREAAAVVGEAPRSGPVLWLAARAHALSGDAAASAGLARRALDAAEPPLPSAYRAEAERRAAGRTASGEGPSDER